MKTIVVYIITQSLSFDFEFVLPGGLFGFSLRNTAVLPPGCVIGPPSGALSRCCARLSPRSAAFLYHCKALEAQKYF